MSLALRAGRGVLPQRALLRAGPASLPSPPFPAAPCGAGQQGEVPERGTTQLAAASARGALVQDRKSTSAGYYRRTCLLSNSASSPALIENATTMPLAPAFTAGAGSPSALASR